VDALRTVAEGVNALAGTHLGILIITHYNRILTYIKPDVVHVMIDGRMVRSGGADLARSADRASARAWWKGRNAAGAVGVRPSVTRNRTEVMEEPSLLMPCLPCSWRGGVWESG